MQYLEDRYNVKHLSFARDFIVIAGVLNLGTGDAVDVFEDAGLLHELEPPQHPTVHTPLAPLISSLVAPSHVSTLHPQSGSVATNPDHTKRLDGILTNDLLADMEVAVELPPGSSTRFLYGVVLDPATVTPPDAMAPGKPHHQEQAWALGSCAQAAVCCPQHARATARWKG